ncbi:MAG: hypothetical protein AAF202_08410, partial [Pseudomonadota bacterium]
MLNETFPAAMAFVDPQNEGMSFVKSFASEMLSNQSPPPLVVATVSEDRCQELRSHLATQGVLGGDLDRIGQFVICHSGVSVPWQQDIVHGSFNRGTGLPHLQFNGSYWQGAEEFSPHPSAGHAFANSVTPAINEYCPGSTSEIHQLPRRNATAGGNFEGIPPNICVVGSGDYEGSELSQVQNEICGPGANVLAAPTSWLFAYHADEIMKTVPAPGPAPCNFRVLVADQSLGQEVVSQNQGELFDMSSPLAQSYFRAFTYAQDENVLDICELAKQLRERGEAPQLSPRGRDRSTAGLELW